MLHVFDTIMPARWSPTVETFFLFFCFISDCVMVGRMNEFLSVLLGFVDLVHLLWQQD